VNAERHRAAEACSSSGIGVKGSCAGGTFVVSVALEAVSNITEITITLKSQIWIYASLTII
jgi:hypothetical protein